MNELKLHQPIEGAPNFTLFEFQNSQVARRRGIDNTIPDDYVPNVEQVAVVLQSLRDFINSPVLISSGYRCVKLNRLVGGVRSSFHTMGRAADFIPVILNSTFEERVARVLEWFTQFSPHSHIAQSIVDTDYRKSGRSIWKLYTSDKFGNDHLSALLIIYYKQHFFHLQLYGRKEVF